MPQQGDMTVADRGVVRGMLDLRLGQLKAMQASLLGSRSKRTESTAPVADDFVKNTPAATPAAPPLPDCEDLQRQGKEEVFAWLNWAPPPQSPAYETLHREFPGALPGQAVHARLRTLLEGERFGLTPANTLLGTSICPDEINNERGDLSDLLQDHWGMCFPLGGISGAPFVGKTGFKAFSHHVPDGGNVLMLFGPHVALADDGEVGKYLRVGQGKKSTACGACIGAYHSCLSKGDRPAPDGTAEFSEQDMQMMWIKSQLAPHVDRIKASEKPMVALAYQSFEAVKEKVLRIVNTDFSSGLLVLVGGIQINLPPPYEDHFLPLFFEVRQQGAPALDLMDEWRRVVPIDDMFLSSVSNLHAWDAQAESPALRRGLSSAARECMASRVAEKMQHAVFSWLRWAPALQTPCYLVLHKYFPGAIPGRALHARMRRALEREPFCFRPENTLVGTSVCPDEINNKKGDIVDLLKAHWGAYFPMGGISAAPFVGKTGFKAFSGHIPDGGNACIVFGPHIGISEAGEVGMYLREGQRQHSTACGAVIGAYCACGASEKSGTPSNEEFDENDMQMAWIKRQLQPHYARISGEECPMAILAHQAYEMVSDAVQGIVNTDFGRGHLALLGGIQINMPPPFGDHFLPLLFEVRRSGCAAQTLEHVFLPPRAQVSI